MALEDHDLDALKQAWQSLDRQLQRQNALQMAELHERKVGRIRSSLHMLTLGQGLQALLGALLIGAFAPLFWSASPLPLTVAGGIFALYGIAIVAVAGRVLAMISGIDRSLPVLELQQRLLRLRKAYIVSGAVAGLPWWLLWLVGPATVAWMRGMSAGDPHLPAWIWLCAAAGALGLLATLGVHRWLHRPGNEARARRVEDHAAGSSLRRAQAELDDLKRFGQE